MAKKQHGASAWRRWAWLWGALAFIVIALALCEWLAWPFLRGPLERGLQKGLAREVSIGPDFGVRFLGSVRARSDSLVIGAPPDGPSLQDESGRPRDFLRATELALELPYSTVEALWRSEPEAVLRVRSLVVDRLELALLRDAQGRANWQFRPKEPKQEEAELPSFGRLVVRRGELLVDDAVTQLALEAKVRTSEGSASAGGLEATAVGSYRKSPLRAHLRASGLLPLAASGTDAAPVPLALELQLGETELRLDGSARDVLALSALDARYDIAGPSLAALGDSLDVTLPTTAAYQMNGRVRKEGERWQLEAERLAVGSSRLRGDLVFDRSAPVPRLTGSLSGSRLALADLAPAFGAPADKAMRAAAEKKKEKEKPPTERRGKGAAPPPPARRVLPQREFDIPSLAQMEADLELAFKQVDLGTEALQPFAPLNGRLILKDSRLTVQDLLARTAGGELRGVIALDARQAARPLWKAELRWSGVRLERFVKAGRGRDTKSGAPAAAGYVGGVLGGRAKLAGQGRSTAAMLGSLDGSTEWWVRDGSMSHLLLEITGIDIAESLGLVISGDESLPVQCAVAQTAFDDGLMTIQVGVIDTLDTTVLVGGTVAFGKEQLDLRLTANPKDFSPLALRSPVTIGGSFAEPDVGLESGALAGRALAGAALAAVVTPLAGLLALVDLGEKEKAVCLQAVQQMRSVAPERKRPRNR